jgi:general stress protein YciG
MAKNNPLTASEMGRKGGTARAKNLSKEKLAEIGKKGAKARWAKKPGRKGGN